MSLFLGIDLGTSYFKVGLFDERGNLKGLGRVRVEPASPMPGRVELAVEEFWRLLRKGVAEALAGAHATARDITALSYSSQANTFVLLDANDVPLTPLIVWTDGRAAPLDPAIAAFASSQAFASKVGFGSIAPEMAAVKCSWFQREHPEMWQRVARVMTISDYLTYSLTGERIGDSGTASLLGLFDLPQARWWPSALAVFGLDETLLSTPLAPGSPGGRTTLSGAARLNLPADIPFAVGGLDHHIAAIGAGIGGLADVSISTGTVLAAVALTDQIAPRPGSYFGPHGSGAPYYCLRFDPLGAGQLEDYQRNHLPGGTIEDLLTLAQAVDVGLSPQMGPEPTKHGSADGRAVRAVLEKIAFQHLQLVREVNGSRGISRIAATGGGARSEFWLQIKADVFGVPVVATPPESACRGAAILAAVRAGVFAEIPEATRAMVRQTRVFEPDQKRTALYRERLSSGSRS